MDERAHLAVGFQEGDLLAGKYRIEKILGAGGMGVVVAAHHIELEQRVAIKFLLPETLANEEAVARFTLEARAAVRIKSEHVARVIDVGKLESGAPYMVMEYLDGSDLSTVLKANGPLSAEQAVDFVLQASEAVAEAHALGIVHRDLKPANLFVVLGTDGVPTVKVLDFGISKITGPSAAVSVTRTFAVVGSPLYMSPEQMQSSRDVDPRSDIWSLGIILYELLAGEPPFFSEAMPELVLKIANMPPASLTERRADLPAGLESAILKALEKDRGRRYETIADLARALVAFGPKRGRISVDRISGVLRAAGLGGSALNLPPSSDARSSGTQTMAPFGRTTSGVRGKRTLVSVAAVVGIALFGIAGAWGVAHFTRSAPQVAPSAASAAAPSAPRLQPRPPGELESPLPGPPSSATPEVSPEAPALATNPAPTRTFLLARKHATPHTTASANKPSPPKPDCDPNFFLDAQGEKHFKPECFTH